VDRIRDEVKEVAVDDNVVLIITVSLPDPLKGTWLISKKKDTVCEVQTASTNTMQMSSSQHRR
jgi:hypothetical protein